MTEYFGEFALARWELTDRQAWASSPTPWPLTACRFRLRSSSRLAAGLSGRSGRKKTGSCSVNTFRGSRGERLRSCRSDAAVAYPRASLVLPKCVDTAYIPEYGAVVLPVIDKFFVWSSSAPLPKILSLLPSHPSASRESRGYLCRFSLLALRVQ